MMRVIAGVTIAVCTALAGCADNAPPPPTPAADTTIAADTGLSSPTDPTTIPRLSPSAHLIRLSLDLRGIRPTTAEFDALDAATDPERELAAAVDRYLEDPRFSGRFQDLYADVTRTRIETLPVDPTDLGIAPEDRAAFTRSLGEEPLALLGDIIARDAPLTELVTASHTMADLMLQQSFPLVRDAGAGWTRALYADGRPHAGWLTQNAFYWRYLSDGVSHGRGRANAVARIFLCADFLSRPVDFPRDLDLTDETAIRNAIRENRGCIGCHASLDPLASFMTGFQYTDKTAAELVAYHPARERSYDNQTGVPPSYYGLPGFSLRELGVHLASDPRFVECLATRGFSFFLGRDPDLSATDDLDALTTFREDLIARGVTARALAEAVVTSPAYARADIDRLVSPRLWASSLEALTGYRFTANGVDMLTSDIEGYLTLAGGSDGLAGSAPARSPTTSMVLVFRRTAEAAASFVVRAASGDSGAHPLFSLTRPDAPLAGDIASNPTVGAQIQAWHRTLFGTTPATDDAAVTAYAQLLADAFTATGDPATAWAAALSALLRDPALVHY